jgi:hypothetical protein
LPQDQPEVVAGRDLRPDKRVLVVGVLVLDTDHGWWTEVHPASIVRSL